MNQIHRILHVNTYDVAGGAEKMALGLAQSSREAGHDAWLAVGRKLSDRAYVFQMADGPATFWAQMVLGLADSLESRVAKKKLARRFGRRLRAIAYPRRAWDRWRGREGFRFPETRRLLALPPKPVDIVHCHNLHGDYFDLRVLPQLSQLVPVVLTLHDEWAYTGHCASTLGCERWRGGCGSCPDLSTYPPIRRDATAENWQAKHNIYGRSQLFVTTPSEWLMSKAKQSSLAPGIKKAKVIPNGIDLAVFRSRDRNEARHRLGLPLDSWILLASANAIRRNHAKDFETIHRSLRSIAKQMTDKVLILIALGDKGPSESEKINRAEIRYVPFQSDPETVANYCQAADLFLHAAHSEVWGLSITEALACGTPVVATAVGGIPEQIRCLHGGGAADAATGVLVPPRDPDAMTDAIMTLLSNSDLLRRMAGNAADDARQRFGVERQMAQYLDWYREVFALWRKSDAAQLEQI